VVSLVPSLTEAVAVSAPGRLVGATDWCTHPAGLAVTRIRGTKNPERARIAALAPDLVIANREENRKLDVARLREAGLAVWVTVIESVPEALASLRRLLTGPLGLDTPGWLAATERAWAGPAPRPWSDRPGRRVAVPVWRDPWMVVGARTFTGDVLTRLGLAAVPHELQPRSAGTCVTPPPWSSPASAPTARRRDSPAAARLLPGGTGPPVRSAMARSIFPAGCASGKILALRRGLRRRGAAGSGFPGAGRSGAGRRRNGLLRPPGPPDAGRVRVRW